MATISKEVEIELEVSDISEAISDLSSREIRELIQDCEMLNEDIVGDFINDMDTDDLKSMIESSSHSDILASVDEDAVCQFIENMDTDDLKSMIKSSSHSSILNSKDDSDSDDIYSQFMKVVRENVNDNDMISLVAKGDDLGVLIKAIVVLSKK